MENSENKESVENLEVSNETPEVIKQPELSPEDTIFQINNSIELNQQKITSLSGSVEETKLKINEKLIELGLPTTDEDPPSVFFSKNELEKLSENQKLLEEQKNEIIKKQEATNTETKEGDLDEKKEDNFNSEKVEKKEDSKKEEISEGVLEKLSESIEIKNNLELKVSAFRDSPLFKDFENRSKNLNENKKRLEELKKPSNSNGINIGGSISMNGSMSFKGDSAFSSTSNQEIYNESLKENEEKKEIDLEQEAENLIAKIEFEILKLQKEEIEYSPEGLSVKNGEIDVESKKIQAETDIWSSGNMNQEKFNETLQTINNPQEGQAELENKELFIKFINAKNEESSYLGVNKYFYESIDNIQKEIDNKEKDIEGIEFPNENKILEILNNHQNKIEDEKLDDKNKEDDISEKIDENNEINEEVPTEEVEVSPEINEEENLTKEEGIKN